MKFKKPSGAATSCPPPSLSPPVMTTWIFSRRTRLASKHCQYPKGWKSGKPPKYAADWCVAAITSRLPIRYGISSRTAKESWKWITARCFCSMTFTRWRKKHSGSTTPRHRQTSRRLTFILSTASGRCNNFRSRLTMTAARKNKSFGISMLINTQCFIAGCLFCDYLCSL